MSLEGRIRSFKIFLDFANLILKVTIKVNRISVETWKIKVYQKLQSIKIILKCKKCVDDIYNFLYLSINKLLGLLKRNKRKKMKEIFF